MALSIILKKTFSVQATGNILKNAVKLDSKRPYTHILNGIKNAPKKIYTPIGSNCLKRSMSGDHGKLWSLERVVSLALLGIVPVAISAPNAILNDALAVATVIHFHWGLEACIVDYVRPILVGNAIPKVAIALLYLISISTLGGLLYYNHHSIGIGNTVRMIWKSEKY